MSFLFYLVSVLPFGYSYLLSNLLFDINMKFPLFYHYKISIGLGLGLHALYYDRGVSFTRKKQYQFVDVCHGALKHSSCDQSLMLDALFMHNLIEILF